MHPQRFRSDETIYAMESDANTLAETIAILSNTKGASRRYIDQWIDYNVLEYTAAKSRYIHDQRAYLAAKEKQQGIRERLHKAEKERETSQERRKQLREQLISMEAQRRIDALQDKDAAERAIANGKNNCSSRLFRCWNRISYYRHRCALPNWCMARCRKPRSG